MISLREQDVIASIQSNLSHPSCNISFLYACQASAIHGTAGTQRGGDPPITLRPTHNRSWTVETATLYTSHAEPSVSHGLHVRYPGILVAKGSLLTSSLQNNNCNLSKTFRASTPSRPPCPQRTRPNHTFENTWYRHRRRPSTEA